MSLLHTVWFIRNDGNYKVTSHHCTMYVLPHNYFLSNTNHLSIKLIKISIYTLIIMISQAFKGKKGRKVKLKYELTQKTKYAK